MLEHGIMVCYFKGGGGEGRCPRKSVAQSACQHDITSRVSNLKMASKVFIEETDNNFDLTTDILYCSDFLDLEMLRFLLS